MSPLFFFAFFLPSAPPFSSLFPLFPFPLVCFPPPTSNPPNTVLFLTYKSLANTLRGLG